MRRKKEKEIEDEDEITYEEETEDMEEMEDEEEIEKEIYVYHFNRFCFNSNYIEIVYVEIKSKFSD